MLHPCSWELLHIHLSAVIWRDPTEQRKADRCRVLKSWDQWKQSPRVARAQSLPVVKEKGHSMWEGFCENGNMTQRRREKRLMGLWHKGESAVHFIHVQHQWFSTCHHSRSPQPPSPTTTSPSPWRRSLTKTSFVLRVVRFSSELIWSCMNISAGKRQMGEQAGSWGMTNQKKSNTKIPFYGKLVWLFLFSFSYLLKTQTCLSPGLG